jgi:hypothetical protein
VNYNDPTGLSGEREHEPGTQLWEILFTDYADSVRQKIKPRTKEEIKEAYHSSKMGLVSEDIDALRQEYNEASIELHEQRLEINGKLNDLYQSLSKAEGNAEIAKIMLAIQCAQGVTEVASTGSAQSISETVYEAGEFIKTNSAIRARIEDIYGDISTGVGEYNELKDKRNAIEQRYFGAEKRTRFIERY